MTNHLSKGVKPETLEISKEIVDLGISIIITSTGDYFEVEIGEGSPEKIAIIDKYFKDLGLT